MRKNLQTSKSDISRLEEGRREEDENEKEKVKNVPLPHWLIPMRSQIQKRPLTSVLVVAALLLVAIIVISNQDAQEVTTSVLQKPTSELMDSWQDARSSNVSKKVPKEKEKKIPKIPLKPPQKTGKKKQPKGDKEKAAKVLPSKPAAPSSESKALETAVSTDVVKRSASGALFTSLDVPEFAYGGKWAERESRAHLSRQQPTPACHATTLVNLPGGEILVAWFGGRYESAEDVAIYVAKRQVDATWTEPIKAAKVHRGVPFNGKSKSNMPPKKGGEPHWNPVLFCQGSDEEPDVCTGEIVLFFKVGWKIPEWETFVTRSTDGGVTWGTPKELVPGDKGGRGPVKNKPILLSNGHWLAPASLEGPAHWEGRRKPWRAFADTSDDNGETWEMSNLVYPESVDEGMIQPTLWETDPGHVFMLTRSMRGNRAKVWRANSTDYGLTWNKPHKTHLPNNNSGLDIVKLPKSGNLVLIYNPVTSGRTPLRLAVSKDNGHTWPYWIELEKERGEVKDGREFSYPAIIAWPKSVEDEGVSVTYTWNRKRVAFFQISLLELEARSDKRQR